MHPDELQKELDRISSRSTSGQLELLKVQIEIEKLRMLYTIVDRLDSFSRLGLPVQLV